MPGKKKLPSTWNHRDALLTPATPNKKCCHRKCRASSTEMADGGDMTSVAWYLMGLLFFLKNPVFYNDNDWVILLCFCSTPELANLPYCQLFRCVYWFPPIGGWRRSVDDWIIHLQQTVLQNSRYNPPYRFGMYKFYKYRVMVYPLII